LRQKNAVSQPSSDERLFMPPCNEWRIPLLCRECTCGARLDDVDMENLAKGVAVG
jgi:hypothetical protein